MRRRRNGLREKGKTGTKAAKNRPSPLRPVLCRTPGREESRSSAFRNAEYLRRAAVHPEAAEETEDGHIHPVIFPMTD